MDFGFLNYPKLKLQSFILRCPTLEIHKKDALSTVMQNQLDSSLNVVVKDLKTDHLGKLGTSLIYTYKEIINKLYDMSLRHIT